MYHFFQSFAMPVVVSKFSVCFYLFLVTNMCLCLKKGARVVKGPEESKFTVVYTR